MFTIDFTKPWLYKDIIYFNQGNLSTNNTLRCKLVTGGSDDFTGGSIACTFTTKDSVEISGFGKLVDAKNGIIDIVFPSNALVVGTNKLEVLVNRADGGIAQSPSISYDIWQGLTTGNGVEAETNYPILIELINSTNEASNKANLALNKANSMIADVTDAIDNAYRSANEADIATSNANTKIEEVETAKTEMIKKVDTSIVTMKSDVEVAKNEMASKADEKIADVDRALAAGTKDLEVKESRRDMDGVEHATLKVRLESDLKKGKVIEETKEGTYLSFNDTIGGLVSYLEVLGNTVQDASNLANIRSSCIPNGDGTFKMSILSVGENLAYDAQYPVGVEYNTCCRAKAKLMPNKEYTLSLTIPNGEVFVTETTVFTRRIALTGDGTRKSVTVTTKDVITPQAQGHYPLFFNEGGKTSSGNAHSLQIQEGNKLTPYIPYQETRCDIKLPCQLDKWDRLYFDKDENAWVVRKGTVTINPTDDILWVMETGSSSQTSSSVRFRIKDNPYATGRNEEVINTHFKNVSDQSGYDSEGVSTSDYNQYGIMIWINKSKLSEVNSTGFNKWRKENNFIAKFGTYTREKIVLPQSEQIKLNSFANKTHIYTISGEVDATIKATVSKSLASTVQANTEEISKINNTIADIQGLKESQDFAYELPNGQNYLVCKDTQNGVVKDLKVYGKSLVNLFKIMSFNFTSNNLYMYQTKELRGVTVGKNITLVNNTPKTIMVDIYNTNTVEWVRTIIINKERCANVTLTSNEYVHTIFGRGDNGWANNDADKELLRNTCIILDGNVEFDAIPSKYFEGIASVGNSKWLEVSTVKIDGNLFDGELKVAHLEGGTNIYRESTVNTLSAIIKIHCGGTYHCKCEGGTRNVIGYFKDKPKPGDAPFKVSNDNITVNDSGYLVFYMTHQSNVVYPTNIMVNFGDIAKPYVDHKEDKKPILFKDIDGTWKPVTELRGVNLSKCDTIEEHNDGKYYRHERILKTLLDGTEQWNLISTATSDTVRCYVLGGGKYIPNDNKNILADKISKYDTASLTDNCIGIDSNGNIVVGIKKSELTTQDVEGVKAYIAKNNITLLSVMPNEKVYEVNPLELESFDNATMWLIFSGVIAPPVSFKITSSLPNFVKELSKQVRQLQDQVYKTNVANFTVALNTLDTKLRLDRLEAPQM